MSTTVFAALAAQQQQPPVLTGIAPTAFSLASDDPAAMVAFFHAHGYIIIRDGLTELQTAALRRDVLALDAEAVRANEGKTMTRKHLKQQKERHIMHKRFFERSSAMVDLVAAQQPGCAIVDFVQRLIEDGVPGARGNALRAHLIHNNAFSVPPGGRGQAPVWHTDDAPQNVILAPGETLPDSVRLPVLAVTCMCWLSDCLRPENGPTFVVPGSHRSGRAVDPELAERFGVPACGPAGTVVIVNNQVWHRGAANTSAVPRITMQMSFGRRMIGHKFGSIMNYRLPPHVRPETDVARERFGFLEGGAYS